MLALQPRKRAHMHRVWRALQMATRCRGVVAVRGGARVMHCGMIRRGAAPGREAELGPIARAAMQSGSGTYLANLILFPGACGWAVRSFAGSPSTCCERVLPCNGCMSGSERGVVH